VTSFSELNCAFLHFSRKRQDGSAQNFFITCIEKHCTQPLVELLFCIFFQSRYRVSLPNRSKLLHSRFTGSKLLSKWMVRYD